MEFGCCLQRNDWQSVGIHENCDKEKLQASMQREVQLQAALDNCTEQMAKLVRPLTESRAREAELQVQLSVALQREEALQVDLAESQGREASLQSELEEQAQRLADALSAQAGQHEAEHNESLRCMEESTMFLIDALRKVQAEVDAESLHSLSEIEEAAESRSSAVREEQQLKSMLGRTQEQLCQRNFASQARRIWDRYNSGVAQEQVQARTVAFGHTEVVDAASIRFTHDSVSRWFKDGRALQSLVWAIFNREVDPATHPNMALSVVRFEGVIYSLNNRRLWCFKEAARWCGQVMVKVKYQTLDRLTVQFILAMTSTNSGTRVTLRG
ncbi:EO [Symbiodinium sp. CCMP2592]|nr:EO [Symbiodinium sp. CCMP2592]